MASSDVSDQEGGDFQIIGDGCLWDPDQKEEADLGITEWNRLWTGRRDKHQRTHTISARVGERDSTRKCWWVALLPCENRGRKSGRIFDCRVIAERSNHLFDRFNLRFCFESSDENRGSQILSQFSTYHSITSVRSSFITEPLGRPNSRLHPAIFEHRR